MTSRLTLSALGLLLTAGCAGGGGRNAYRDPAAAADHPANPTAAAAPAPEAFTTLSLTGAAAPSRPPALEDAHAGHDADAAHGDPAAAHDAHAGHAAAPASQPAASAAAYVCPMHPKVTSATPGICPTCEMKLVKATAPAAAGKPAAAPGPRPDAHEHGARR